MKRLVLTVTIFLMAASASAQWITVPMGSNGAYYTSGPRGAWITMPMGSGSYYTAGPRGQSWITMPGGGGAIYTFGTVRQHKRFR